MGRALDPLPDGPEPDSRAFILRVVVLCLVIAWLTHEIGLSLALPFLMSISNKRHSAAGLQNDA
jgi:hypothetical protein